METFSVLGKVYAPYRIDVFPRGVAMGRGSDHVFSLWTLIFSDSVTAGGIVFLALVCWSLSPYRQTPLRGERSVARKHSQ